MEWRPYMLCDHHGSGNLLQVIEMGWGVCEVRHVLWCFVFVVLHGLDF